VINEKSRTGIIFLLAIAENEIVLFQVGHIQHGRKAFLFRFGFLPSLQKVNNPSGYFSWLKFFYMRLPLYYFRPAAG